jgi:hydrogenase-4 component E
VSETLYSQLLDLACGAVLLTAVLVLWRRPPAVRVFAVQGVALAGLTAVLAAHQGVAWLWAVAAGILVLRAGLLPRLLRRVEPDSARPVLSVPVTLLVAAGLTLLAHAVAQPLVDLAPAAASRAIPIGVAVVLLGFLLLATRRRAAAQLAGILLMDNGITVVGLLTGAGLGLVVQLAVALDVLLVLLILRPLGAAPAEAPDAPEAAEPVAPAEPTEQLEPVEVTEDADVTEVDEPAEVRP